MCIVMVIVCQWLVSVIIKFRCLAPVMPIQNQTWTHQHTSRKWFIIRAFPGLIKETRTGVFIIDNPGTAPATDKKRTLTNSPISGKPSLDLWSCLTWSCGYHEAAPTGRTCSSRCWSERHCCFSTQRTRHSRRCRKIWLRDCPSRVSRPCRNAIKRTKNTLSKNSISTCLQTKKIKYPYNMK